MLGLALLNSSARSSIDISVIAAVCAGRNLSSSSSSSSIPDDLRAAFGYCVSQTKKYDPENFAWCSQLPREHRPAFFALRAFNIETALVAETVRSREQAMLQIRFQWWRDALAAIAHGASPPEHPVAQALHHVSAVAALPLQRYNLRRIVDTREQDALASQPPLRVSDLEQYAEGSASQLLYLQLQALDVQDRAADHAASHVGKAVGIATLLRGTAHHAAARRSYLPLEVCAQYSVSQEAIYRGDASPALRDAVLQVAAVAKGHLDEARALCSQVPAAGRAALLPAVACGQYLKALEARDFNPFDPALLATGGISPLMHVLRLKYHLLFRTY